MDQVLFFKYQATGNDFVILDNRDGHLDVKFLLGLAPKMCDRRFGIGADGVLVVEAAEDPRAVARMRVFNSDGSEAEMCGNGLRCVGRWLGEMGEISEREFFVETLGGLQFVRYIHNDVESSEPWSIEITLDHVKLLEEVFIPFSGKDLKLQRVDLGNPHAVLELEHGVQEAIDDYGSTLSLSSAFGEEGTNIEIFCRLDKDAVEVAFHERGVGKTLACGTGCVATACVFAERYGYRGNYVRLITKGGELSVFVPESGEQGFKLRGPVCYVFCGVLNLGYDRGLQLSRVHKKIEN